MYRPAAHVEDDELFLPAGQLGMGWWGDAWDEVKSVAKKVQANPVVRGLEKKKKKKGDEIDEKKKNQASSSDEKQEASSIHSTQATLRNELGCGWMGGFQKPSCCIESKKSSSVHERRRRVNLFIVLILFALVPLPPT